MSAADKMESRVERRNPYLGPRPFTENDKLFGREAELEDLVQLILAERIVLLYSPSGAGKTSLIQSKLVPKLREEAFQVLPIMRVGFGATPSKSNPFTYFEKTKKGGQTSERRRFVDNALTSLRPAPPKRGTFK